MLEKKWSKVKSLEQTNVPEALVGWRPKRALRELYISQPYVLIQLPPSIVVVVMDQNNIAGKMISSPPSCLRWPPRSARIFVARA